jgi:hypothetical protein
VSWYERLGRVGRRLAARLAIATVAALSAAGLGMLAAPSAHAGLDGAVVVADQRQAALWSAPGESALAP